MLLQHQRGISNYHLEAYMYTFNIIEGNIMELIDRFLISTLPPPGKIVVIELDGNHF